MWNFSRFYNFKKEQLPQQLYEEIWYAIYKFHFDLEVRKNAELQKSQTANKLSVITGGDFYQNAPS